MGKGWEIAWERYQAVQSKKQKHVNKHRISEGKYLWLQSLWNSKEPERSEITLAHLRAVENMWKQQKTKVMLTGRQMKFFNDIYETYQRKDVR